MTTTDLGYSESQKKLAIRIAAHKDYSNFNLEDWVKQHLPFAPGNLILDIGCGSGNLFPVYSEMIGSQGTIVGMDQSTELLSTAQSGSYETQIVLMQWDLNKTLPFIDNSFDYVISTFAIYYADDVTSTLRDIRRLLKPGGRFFLIGPTKNNAKELYEFNHALFGFGLDDKVSVRTNRLESEFLPTAPQFFADVRKEIIPSKLTFPGTNDFACYYEATLLYEESLKTSGQTEKDVRGMAASLSMTELSKEMCVIRGRKP